LNRLVAIIAKHQKQSADENNLKTLKKTDFLKLDGSTTNVSATVQKHEKRQQAFYHCQSTTRDQPGFMTSKIKFTKL